MNYKTIIDLDCIDSRHQFLVILILFSSMCRKLCYMHSKHSKWLFDLQNYIWPKSSRASSLLYLWVKLINTNNLYQHVNSITTFDHNLQFLVVPRGYTLSGITYIQRLKLPSRFTAWHFWTFHNKSCNMKALVILSHSWSPFLPLTCLYGKKWTFLGLCLASWSISATKNSP